MAQIMKSKIIDLCLFEGLQPGKPKICGFNVFTLKSSWKKETLVQTLHFRMHFQQLHCLTHKRHHSSLAILCFEESNPALVKIHVIPG